MSNLTETLDDAARIIHQRFKAQDDCIEKMEKALSEEMAKTREMDDILAGVVKDVERLKHYSPVKWSDMKVRDDGSVVPPDPGVSRVAIWESVPNIIIDPTASPKNIPFSVALEYLKAGRRICRSQWELGACAVIRPGKGIVYECTTYAERFKPENNDMLSTDWMVIPEKP